MPAQTAQSSLFGGNAKALHQSTQQHANDTATYRNQRLPGGIKNGIARLVKIGFGVYDGDKEPKWKGKPFFEAMASVVHPLTFTDKEGNVHKTAGMLTYIAREPMFDTPERALKTFDDHYAYVLNQIRILNGGSLPDLTVGQTAGMTDDQKGQVVEQNLVKFLENLSKAKPFTKFETSESKKQIPEERNKLWWLGKKGPYPSLDALKAALPWWDKQSVFENWNGATAYEMPNLNGAAAPAKGIGQPAAQKPAPVIPQSPPPAAEPEPAPFDDGAASMEELIAGAGNADNADLRKTCQARLKVIALEAGLTEEQVDEAPDWEALANQIEQARAGGPEGEGEGEAAEGEGEGEGEAEDPWEPAKGEVYPFHPLGVNKKPLKTKVDGTVTTVNTTKQTVTLNGSDKKVYKDVAWARLLRE